MPFAEWRALGQRLAREHDHVAWALGDWCCYGEARYGERRAMTVADDWNGPSFKTLMNYASVCRAYPDESSRHREVSFSHHAEAALLPSHRDRASALDWAAKGKHSVRGLREEVQRRQHATNGSHAKAAVTHDQITLLTADCHHVLTDQPSDSVALVIFSPPYGNMRRYGGANSYANLPLLGRQINRILVPGGVCVVVIADPVERGRRRIDSHRMVVDWCDNVGLNLLQPLVYAHIGSPGTWAWYFRSDHEMMYVFCKGERPRHCDKTHLATPRNDTKARMSGRRWRGEDHLRPFFMPSDVTRQRGSIWSYSNKADHAERTADAELQRDHPARFPLQLARDHMLCWTQPGDLVVDPFVGSGTTAVVCARTGRRCLGIDIHAPYIDIARQRDELALAERIPRQNDEQTIKPAAATATEPQTPPSTPPGAAEGQRR